MLFSRRTNIHQRGPDLLSNASYSQLSYESPPQQQQSGYTAGTHPTSPFGSQNHHDHIAEVVRLTDHRQVPETRSAQGDKNGGRGPKNWLCSYGDCNKKYRRLQELRRHTADKHEVPSKCLFCDYTWSRPERMRRHLIYQHRHHFTEEERQEIRGLRGRRDTIGFLLARCSLLPGRNAFRAQSDPSSPQLKSEHQ